MEEIIELEISNYLTDEIYNAIKSDLEKSNNRKIEDIEILFDEIEIKIVWRAKNGRD